MYNKQDYLGKACILMIVFVLTAFYFKFSKYYPILIICIIPLPTCDISNLVFEIPLCFHPPKLQKILIPLPLGGSTMHL